jgi:hypothetical protein
MKSTGRRRHGCQGRWGGPAYLPGVLAIMLSLSCSVCVEAQEKSLFREQPPLTTAEPVPRLSQAERGREIQIGGDSLSRLSADFKRRVEQHLQAAGSYDLESFARNDDEIAALLEKIDAAYLNMQKLCNEARTAPALLAQARDEITRSKLMMYKSSAIFYLCFAQPLQSARCARLALSLAGSRHDFEDYLPDMLFYLGAANCWSADYKAAEEALNQARTEGQLRSFTQLEAGQKVNQSGQNPFTGCYLGSVFIAAAEPQKAVEVLNSSRLAAGSDEIRGDTDALLTLAYTLAKKPELARRHAQLARQELENKSGQVFPAVAGESLGIVSALSGEFAQAELKLTEALDGLKASPVKLGNRLEAAQTALWLAYCREKLGKKEAAAEDRRYAMSFAAEAPHLATVARMLDLLAGKPVTGQAGESVKNKWAVVVGLSNFADPSVPRLRYSRKDAEDMTNFLTGQAGFPADHVKTLLDGAATRANLLDCLSGSWLPAASSRGDLVFLYISSHGTPAYKEIGALNSVVTYDTNLDHLFSTTIPMQALVRIMRSKLPGRHAFLILDTCYAGGLGAPGEAARTNSNVDPDLLLSSSRQLLVSSSDAGERSWESKRYQNSVFTRQLINTLRERLQYDDFKPVFSTIRGRVAAEVSADFKGHTQTPRLSGIWSGQGLIKPKENHP